MIDDLDEEESDREESLPIIKKLKPTVLKDSRHLEKIEKYKLVSSCWRHKDRMKTVSVAIALCLNIPVDPPDVVKLQPCARIEAWIDPLTLSSTKAIDAIEKNLQKAYERWQPKARYKVAKDPTVDGVKKLCTSLRRNAKEERVLFHYNGHGVPRPTDNGEIWVFNSSYTQYIPLSIYDLQQWMGTPSIYVYDCSHAGKIVKIFKSFVKTPDDIKCIHFGACGEKQMLPMNPDLPADVFTACLTTPLKMAIRFYFLQHKKRFLPFLTLDMLDKIPGQLNDRRSMLGELNWIFTAVTDTIAWSILPTDQFQKLFRQDLLVASLFRNFILSERILRNYDCVPISSPALPSAAHHHMWASWDLALESALSQLPKMINVQDKPERPHEYILSPFFADQLTAFERWLDHGSAKRPSPEQLPSVLQVLLSQSYRPRALELLGRFLLYGPWSVNLVLEVGIFPYILKLLQSTIEGLRAPLTLLWTKILAVDPQCKVDLVRENGSKYFANIFKDPKADVEHRTMSCFVICALAPDQHEGMPLAIYGKSILPTALECTTVSNASLRQWATILAARSWYLNSNARWEATRNNAPDKLANLLQDFVPEVRAAAAYALGTFLRSLPMSDRYDHGRMINHKIAVSLRDRILDEASPLVRKEILVALHYLIIMYESSFKQVAAQAIYSEDSTDSFNNASNESLTSISSKNLKNTMLRGTSPVDVATEAFKLLSPVARKSSNFASSRQSHEHLYMKVWQSVMLLENDPYPGVAELANDLSCHVQNILLSQSSMDSTKNSTMISSTHDDSDVGMHASKAPSISEDISSSRISSRLTPRRSSVPSHSPSSPLSEDENFVNPIITTDFFEWCANCYRKSAEPTSDKEENSIQHFLDVIENNSTMRKMEPEIKVHSSGQKLDEQKFIGRTQEPAENVIFHPTHQLLLISDRNFVTTYDISNYETARAINYFRNNESVSGGRVSSMVVLNSHQPSSYLCTSATDGAIRVWKDAFKADMTRIQQSPQSISSSHHQVSGTRSPHFTPSAKTKDTPTLITAFYGMDDIPYAKRKQKILMSWEQDTTTLILAGNSDKIRFWDLQAETKIRDINNKMQTVTSLHSVSGEMWVAAGYSNGIVRLYDRRSSNPLMREWKDHQSPIINTQVFNASAAVVQIISGAVSGEVRLYDIRRENSVEVNQPNQKLLCMSYHPKAHMYATGTAQSQQINVHRTDGTIMNHIRYFNGLMAQKIGNVQCMSFHPTQVLLAVGTREGAVSVFGLGKKTR